ncbi:hypothetical protein WMY93_008953 [Mugilogobius chulae]|uniref:Uncharacterized protein n=1 Tax=Mugilogobius chulae TaxID=88201 RepID=A0AAW0PAD9_9GOBI
MFYGSPRLSWRLIWCPWTLISACPDSDQMDDHKMKEVNDDEEEEVEKWRTDCLGFPLSVDKFVSSSHDDTKADQSSFETRCTTSNLRPLTFSPLTQTLTIKHLGYIFSSPPALSALDVRCESPLPSANI